MTVIKRFNNAFGTTTDSPLGSTATTMNSQELPRLGVVDSANNEIARLTLDPERNDGAPEIIHVTSYDGSATSATIERGKEGTTAREHASGTTWEHAPTVEDFADRGAQVYLGSAQSISNTTFEKVLVDTVIDDPDGLFNSANNQIDADRDGWWLVSIGVGFDGDTSGDQRIAAIAQNGTRIADTKVPPIGSAQAVLTNAEVVKAAAGDTFEAQAWQDRGGSLALTVLKEHTRLSAVYLGRP